MSLNEVWQAASASPYTPLVSKDSQFFVGFSLLLAGEPDPTSLTLQTITNLHQLSSSLDFSV